MPGKKDKPTLEEIFRKKAGEYDIPYEEADWLDLERKLEIRDIRRAYVRRVRWIAAASVLVVSLLGYFTFENNARINQVYQQLSEAPAAGPEPGGAAFGDLDGSRGLGEPDEEAEQLAGPGGADGSLIPGLPGDEEGSSEETEGSALADVGSEDGFASTAATDPAESFAGGSSDGLSGMPVLPGRGTGDTLAGEPGPGRAMIAAATLPETGLLGIRDSDLPERHRPARGLFPNQPELPPASVLASSTPARPAIGAHETALTDIPAPRSPGRFSLGLVMAPDFSMAGSISSLHEPGYKVGLTAEYDLGSGFSISSGIIYSVVRYSGRGSRYNPPAGWSGGATPQEVIAECLLLDIPLTLKYNVLDLASSRFFVTAGISSYIMLNEDYQFRYDEYGSGLNTTWSRRTGTRHWASNAGFSIGYELDIHPSLSLRAEPFLKLPMQEVGWANVNLYSMGSFISLNYRL